MTRRAFFAALICVSALIAAPAPFSPVPITFQTFAVSAASLILPGFGGVVSAAVYVFCGAAGLPVFAGGGAGFSALIGPTGGFIAGFPLMAAVIAAAKNVSGKFTRNEYAKAALAVAAGHTALYALGAAWFAFSTNRPVSDALALCVLPFAGGDAVKAALAALTYISVKKYTRGEKSNG